MKNQFIKVTLPDAPPLLYRDRKKEIYTKVYWRPKSGLLS